MSTTVRRNVIEQINSLATPRGRISALENLATMNDAELRKAIAHARTYTANTGRGWDAATAERMGAWTLALDLSLSSCNWQRAVYPVNYPNPSAWRRHHNI